MIKGNWVIEYKHIWNISWRSMLLMAWGEFGDLSFSKFFHGEIRLWTAMILSNDWTPNTLNIYNVRNWCFSRLCHLLKPDSMSLQVLTALHCQSDDQLETCRRKCASVVAYVFGYLENTSVLSCYVISGGFRFSFF